ncbi:MAG: anti-sigma factor family protein [Pseudonocardiaceae bacterium]
MTDLRGHTFADLLAGLNAHQHLAVDAVVAFVDGELGAGARNRAAEHVAVCQSCAAEVVGQRHARSVVRSAGYPQIPADLLATLRDIPQTADLSAVPDGLAVTDDGTVVTAADPGRASMASLSGTAPLGQGPRWGSGSSILGRSMLGRSMLGRRIGRTGAGAVVSGLVLGALIMTMLENPDIDSARPQPEGPSVPAFPAPSIVPAVARVTQPGAGAVPGDHGSALR